MKTNHRTIQSCRVREIGDGFVKNDCDSHMGSSGSPLICKHKGQWKAVAIQTNSFCNGDEKEKCYSLRSNREYTSRYFNAAITIEFDEVHAGKDIAPPGSKAPRETLSEQRIETTNNEQDDITPKAKPRPEEPIKQIDDIKATDTLSQVEGEDAFIVAAIIYETALAAKYRPVNHSALSFNQRPIAASFQSCLDKAEGDKAKEGHCVLIANDTQALFEPLETYRANHGFLNKVAMIGENSYMLAPDKFRSSWAAKQLKKEGLTNQDIKELEYYVQRTGRVFGGRGKGAVFGTGLLVGQGCNQLLMAKHTSHKVDGTFKKDVGFYRNIYENGKTVVVPEKDRRAVSGKGFKPKPHWKKWADVPLGFDIALNKVKGVKRSCDGIQMLKRKDVNEELKDAPCVLIGFPKKRVDKIKGLSQITSLNVL